MAKGNMLLGNARGKVGSLVFYEKDGSQCVRGYQPRVSNPRTTAQQVNRAIMNTVTQAWKYLKDLSIFEGFSKRQFRKEFFKRNIRILRDQIDTVNPLESTFYSPLLSSKFQPNPYVVTVGSLAMPFQMYFVDETEFQIITSVDMMNVTYEDVANMFSLERYDSLCFVIVYFNVDEFGTEGSLREIEIVKWEIVLNPVEDGVELPMSSNFAIDGYFQGYDLNKIPRGYDPGLFESGIFIYAEMSHPLIASAFYLKKRTGEVSNCNLLMNPNMTSMALDDYPDLVYTLGQAISIPEIYVESPRYLNNAT